MNKWARVLFLLTGPVVASQACIWDSDTLKQERRARPEFAKVILSTAPPSPVDTAALQRKLRKLKERPAPDSPDWLNEVAGAHLRLGQAQEAADMLGPVRDRFADNYGIHANLGTALHLLGRYAEAEKEIARDLEINPDAHFGLEKYHLALLQYLTRDADS